MKRGKSLISLVLKLYYEDGVGVFRVKGLEFWENGVEMERLPYP